MKKYLGILILLISYQSITQEKNSSIFFYDELKEHPFGSISENYTLTLTGYFDDCGEFGGHEETIEVKRVKSRLIAIITIYDKSCQDSNYKKPKTLSVKEYAIDDSQLILLQNYLSELLFKTLEFYLPHHAGRQYSAKLEFAKADSEDDYNFTRIALDYHDTGNTWPGFIELKKQIEK